MTDMAGAQKMADPISSDLPKRHVLEMAAEGAEYLAVANQSVSESTAITQVVGNQLAQCYSSLPRGSFPTSRRARRSSFAYSDVEEARRCPS